MPALGSLVEDVRRTVDAARSALGGVVSVVEWVKVLQPLADAALRGDRSAERELARIAEDGTELPAARGAARLLLEYVSTRRKAGMAATQVGVGLYPGQVNPLIVGGVVLMALLLWRRKG